MTGDFSRYSAPTAATVLADMAAVLVSTIGQDFWQNILPDLSELWHYLDISAGQTALYAAELIITALLSAMASYLMFYAAIALGHSFANHKILLSVVFYIAFSVGLQIIGSFAGIYSIVAGVEGDWFYDLDPYAIPHLAAGFSALSTLLVGAVFYVVTQLTLKKRLNLQ